MTLAAAVSCCADYVDENGELLDEIILPQGALSGKDEAARGSSGGARRGSKAAGMDSNCVDMSGLTPDFVNQAAFAAIMQQGAWQVGGGAWRGGQALVDFGVLPYPTYVPWV
jgi:hypothetical protein